MAIEVTRTYAGSIRNHRQVYGGLNSLGGSASKVWNVTRWTDDRIWDGTGDIPGGGVLKSYMNNRPCWKDLNAQSSQNIIQEPSGAFQSWFDLRHKFDGANPPGYHKRVDERPRSAVTFKEDGFKQDLKNNRVRFREWGFRPTRTGHVIDRQISNLRYGKPRRSRRGEMSRGAG